MAVNRMFRTCPSTGLVYHEPAEKLIRWNAVAMVVRGQSEFTAIPSEANSAANPSVHMLIPYLAMV